MCAKNIRPSAKREIQKERSATIKLRALGTTKFESDENMSAMWADF